MVFGSVRNTAALLVVALLPIVINLIGFSKYASSDPLYLMSGLYAATTSNLLPGLPGWIDPNSGTNSQALGYLAAEIWMSGEVPWWNHYSGAGLPLAAAMQTHALFLPFILLMHFANGPLLLKISLQIVAGVATYLLLKQLSMRKTAAFVGAVAYAFNGTFAWFSDSVMTTIAFLPLFILGIEYALDASKTRSRGWLVISLALALSLYAGFPETAYINGLLALTWACVRLVKGDSPDRLKSLFKIVSGGIVGLLLSAPLFAVFGGLLLESEVSHRIEMTARGLNANSFVAMLFPYFSGPISAFGQYDADPSVVDMWSNIGGYATLPFFLAAIFGAFGRTNRWMRVTLAAWAVCSMLLVFWVLPTWNPITYVPGMKYIAFFRYAWPSIEFCISILAAFFVNDLREEELLPLDRRQRGITWLFVLTILFAASLFVIKGKLMFFLATEFRMIFFLSTLISFVLLAIIPGCLMLASRAEKTRVRISVVVLLIASVGSYALPLLSGKSVSHRLPGSVTFLRENLGLNRFYTLGPFVPNYSAYFKLGSINDIYNPVPAAWATYVNKMLDPGASAGLFIGNWPTVDGSANRSEAFVRNVQNFERTGVKFVIAPSGSNPFLHFQPPANPPTVPYLIPAKVLFRDAVVLNPPLTGTLKAFSIFVGTFGGMADGDLVLDLCGANTCGHGHLALKDVADNSSATFVLDREIALTNEEKIEFSIRQNNSSHPIALWRWLDNKPTEKSLLSVNSKISVSLTFSDDYRYRKVYEDTVVAIYQLSNPAAYVETVSGHCEIAIENRNALKANCDRPSTILRREMFYPGWEATLNGSRAPITMFDELFQSVEVPSGITYIQFRYFPPYMRIGFAGLALGLIAVVMCFWRKLHASSSAN